jgi:hypothetical protein
VTEAAPYMAGPFVGAIRRRHQVARRLPHKRALKGLVGAGRESHGGC